MDNPELHIDLDEWALRERMSFKSDIHNAGISSFVDTGHDMGF